MQGVTSIRLSTSRTSRLTLDFIYILFMVSHGADTKNPGTLVTSEGGFFGHKKPLNGGIGWRYSNQLGATGQSMLIGNSVCCSIRFSANRYYLPPRQAGQVAIAGIAQVNRILKRRKYEYPCSPANCPVWLAFALRGPGARHQHRAASFPNFQTW